MDFNHTQSSNTQSKGFNTNWVLLFLAILGYACLIIFHVNACAGGSDSSGYLNHAKALSEGHLLSDERTIDGVDYLSNHSYLYSPLGLKPAPVGHGLVATYPPGLPLMLMGASFLTGWNHVGDYVMVIHCLAGILLLFQLARAMNLSFRYSTLAAIILATSPLYLNYSVQLMSDLPAMVWVTLAVLAAWKSNLNSEGTLKWALLSGFAVSIAVLIRPTNVLIFIPALIALGLNFKRLTLFAVGGLPGALFFAIHSAKAYGHVGVTGYGDASSMFESQYVLITVSHYAYLLPILFTPVVVLSVGLIFVIKHLPRLSLVLLTWIGTYLGLYAFYSCTHETWWYMRFILPCAPALIIGGLIILNLLIINFKITERFKRFESYGFLISCILISISGASWTNHYHALSSGKGESVYPKTAAWLTEHAPSNAVILAMQESGALYYYTPFTIIRWDELDKALTNQIILKIKEQHRPLFAPLFNWEKTEALTQRFPGEWIKRETFKDVTIWERLNK